MFSKKIQLLFLFLRESLLCFLNQFLKKTSINSNPWHLEMNCNNINSIPSICASALFAFWRSLVTSSFCLCSSSFFWSKKNCSDLHVIWAPKWNQTSTSNSQDILNLSLPFFSILTEYLLVISSSSLHILDCCPKYAVKNWGSTRLPSLVSLCCGYRCNAIREKDMISTALTGPNLFLSSSPYRNNKCIYCTVGDHPSIHTAEVIS